MKRLLPVLILATCVVGIPVYAHHSFASYYFENQTTTLEGEVVEFQYKSPHAWVHVMAKDDKGQMQRFGLEWANTKRLEGYKVTKDTLKPGDYVIVAGSPGRNASERRLHLKGITRPSDGWTWGKIPAQRSAQR